ncbi:MAG: ATPase domain-containing protein [Thermoproteota archaeon]|nr:recombinase RecA [Candidatus Brockarchaeota archaeon]
MNKLLQLQRREAVTRYSCPVCGRPLSIEYKFCPSCGTPRKGISYVRKVSTGNPAIDEILEGGFEAGKTYLLAGEAGTGKTIFSLQYLIYGAKNNEPGIYVTIDERPEVLIRDVRNFGWDLQPLMESRKLSIIPVRRYFTSKMWGREMDAIVNNIVEELDRKKKEIGAKRLVIDPIAPLVTTYSNEIAWVREYIRSLIFSIEERLGVTTLITSEIPTGENAMSRYGVEEFLASGVIILSLTRVGNSIIRTMFIRKMRWTAVNPTIYRFEIERGRGIVLKEALT